MSVACARYFASDWELASLVEFLGDLRLRAADALNDAGLSTVERLSAHLALALQTYLVRSMDNYVAYLRDVLTEINALRDEPLPIVILDETHVAKTATGNLADLEDDAFADALRISSALKLTTSFYAASELPLFQESDDSETLARLMALRNLVAYNRAPISESLSSLVGDTPSSELGFDWKRVRRDLVFLRRSVRNIDDEASAKWSIARPVAYEQFLQAIDAAKTGKSLEYAVQTIPAETT
jgi:hypothetical protein